MEESKEVCIQSKGTRKHGKKIIEYLVSIGGNNAWDYNGRSKGCFYYIAPGNEIAMQYSFPIGYKEIEV